MITWKPKLGPLTRLIVGLRRGSLMKPVFTQWLAMYSSYVRQQFQRNSRGGGEWPDLAESTKRARAKKKAAKRKLKGANITERKFAILRDSGILFNALSIGVSGNYAKIMKDGVQYGFAPVQHGSDSATIQEIATFHDEGGKNGRPPKREILKVPTPQLANAMLKAMSVRLRKI